ncbi:discoidin domain-containing protein [Borborobacter arsenicus]|nr:discoidin domain-containing protein [Pseudaminobacter arsenicus]
MEGTLAALSGLSGGMAVTRKLEAAIAAASAVSGTLGIRRGFAGALPASSALQGNLRAGGFAGDMASSAALAGGLSVKRAVAGAVDSLSTFSGAPTITRRFAGAVAGVSAMAGDLSIETPVGYRYLRVRVTANDGANQSRITELYWAETAGGPSVATGGLASGSTELLGATNAFDGNTSSTSWLSANVAPPHWLQYDLGTGNSAAPVELRMVARQGNGFTVFSQAPKDFTIEGSNDGAAWDVLRSVTGQTAWGVGEERTFSL